MKKFMTLLCVSLLCLSTGCRENANVDDNTTTTGTGGTTDTTTGNTTAPVATSAP